MESQTEQSEKGKPTNCFFCNKEIQTLYKNEKRTYDREHYLGESTVKVLIPAESNLVKIKLKPTYEKLLENLIAEAEAKVQEIIEEAISKANEFLESYNKILGSGNKVSAAQNYFTASPERRADDTRKLFCLQYLTHELEKGVSEIKGCNKYNGERIIAHKDCCTKSELTLEEIASKQIIESQFKEELAKLPKPMQEIYNKLGKEKISIEATPYDFIEYITEN